MFEFLGEMITFFLLGGGEKKEDRVEEEFPEIFNDNQNFDDKLISTKEKVILFLKIIFAVFILFIIYIITK